MFTFALPGSSTPVWWRPMFWRNLKQLVRVCGERFWSRPHPDSACSSSST